MKTLLAVNTTGGRCSVAVGSSQLILAESNLAAERGHSEILIPMIEETLHKSRTTLNELAGFLVCSGPGNYTSLRIAISAILPDIKAGPILLNLNAFSADFIALFSLFKSS